MNTIKLKNMLFQRISQIEDISFLNAIGTILETKIESDKINLTAEQKKEIISSQSDVQKGMFVENDVLDTEIKTWLNES